MTNIEELKELNKLNNRLTSLLEDPQPGLHTWKIMLAEVLTKMSEFAPLATDETPTILATAHSDDWVVEVNFDARLWFEQASVPMITDLIYCGFRGDYPADEVAIWMTTYDPSLKRMFTYIEITNQMGFECAVNIEQAVKWLEKEKPELKKVLEEAEVEGLI